MESYRIDCPICDEKSKQKIQLSDTGVIYNVQGFESQPNILWSWRRPDPTDEEGTNMLVDRAIVETDSLRCDNNHYIVVRHCHYGEVDNESNMLYGPSNKPKIRCPKCEYRLGDHSKYIYRITNNDEMQYILRSISDTSVNAYRHVESVTRSSVGNFDQVSTIKSCPNCGLDIHLNYSNKKYNKEEKYEGYIRR